MGKIFGVTGHRLNSLICKYDRFHPWKLEKLKLFEEYLKFNRPEGIISGGALGFDQWAIYVALKLKIPLTMYVPCLDQDKLWANEHKKQYRDFLAKADKVIYVCDGGYAKWKMLKRDDKIVEDSDLILALWNPEKRSGGTFHTISHAFSLTKPVMNFWPENPILIEGLY